jgi:plasmid stability protein
MANLSVRGLDERSLSALKRRAAHENASVNAVVLQLIEQGLGLRRAKGPPRRHGDLDALAGTWTQRDASEMARVTAPFAEIDPRLWK